MESVWVWGKVEPGWYMAKYKWDDWYAAHLRKLGYKTAKSIYCPSLLN